MEVTRNFTILLADKANGIVNPNMAKALTFAGAAYIGQAAGEGEHVSNDSVNYITVTPKSTAAVPAIATVLADATRDGLLRRTWAPTA